MKDRDDGREVKRLRELLDRAAPADPVGARRVAEIAKRRGTIRRERSFVGALAVGVAAATIIVVPHFFRTSPTSNASNDDHVTSTSSTATNSPGQLNPLADPCPAIPILATRSSSHPAPLESGATMVRLCEGRGWGRRSAWTAPEDGLVTNIGALVSTLNTLPKAPIKYCALETTAMLAHSLAVLRFSYPDGHTVLLKESDWPCGLFELNGTLVAPSTVLDAFRAALVTQRQTLQPPTQAVPDCAAASSAPKVSWMRDRAHRIHFVAGRLCTRPGAGTGPAPLSATVVHAIDADFNAHVTRLRTGKCLVGSTEAIIGVDAWGDVDLLGREACWSKPVQFNGLGRSWIPRQATLRLLGL